jgi:hypothetical protein
MNHSRWKIFSAFILAILIIGLLPFTVYAAPPTDVVIGNSYTLESGKVLNDDLLIIGGSVNLMTGSTVNGSVILIGGSLNAAGTIDGELAVFGGTVNLASTFVLNGDLITAGAAVNRDPAAQINGQIYTGGNTPNLVLPGGVQLPNLASNFNPLFRVGSYFVSVFLWALIAMIVAMFIPAHLTRSSQTALTQPIISGGLGCITILIVPMLLVLLAITICLIPVALIGAFILAIAWVFGLVALGLEVGKRISGMFKQDWHPAISAGVGTLALMVVLSGIQTIIPCVGWIPQALVGMIGLGAVMLTQFGSKSYDPTPSQPEAGSDNSLPAGVS